MEKIYEGKKKMKIIDATGLILGRMATYVAKQALLGEEVAILNCEKVIITGTQEALLKEYKERQQRRKLKLPSFHLMPYKFVKRAIRGMLPKGHFSEQSRGRLAFNRIKCYTGVPAEFEGKKAETIKSASSANLKTPNYMTVDKLTRLLRGKK